MNILNRRELNKTLIKIFDYSGIFIQAPIGYGKTTNVKKFLSNQRNIETLYFSMHHENDEAWAWKKISDLLGERYPSLKATLSTVGLPKKREAIEIVIDALKHQLQEPLVMVIDDCQMVNKSLIEKLLLNLIVEVIPNLHIVFISREEPSKEIFIHIVEKTILHLTKEHFRFSREEIKHLFLANDCDITEELLDQIEAYSEGWVTVLQLMYTEEGVVINKDKISDFKKLLKISFYDKLTLAQQRMLMKLSVLESFSKEQANFITLSDKTSSYIELLVNMKNFVRFDTKEKKYFISPVLREFLEEELRLSSIDIKKLYIRVGQWFLLNGEHLQAISAYYQTNEYARILELMETNYDENYMDIVPSFIVEIFNRIPLNIKLKYPYAYLHYINDYIINIEAEKGMVMLQEFIAYLQKGKFNEETNQLIGELTLLEGCMQYNNLRKMGDYFQRAYELMNKSRSKIGNYNQVTTYGAYEVLYLYHITPGDLASLIVDIEDKTKYYTFITKGGNAGMEAQTQAEFAYAQGRFDEVETLAWEGYTKAIHHKQYSVAMCSLFTLGKLAIANKDKALFERVNKMLQESLSREQIPITISEIECIVASLAMKTNAKDKVPCWIQKGRLDSCHLLHECFSVSYLVYGEYLMYKEEYLKLTMVCNVLKEMYKDTYHLFGDIHIKIYESICLYSKNDGHAKQVLQEALQLAKPDRLLMPFVEKAKMILPLLKMMEEDSFTQEIILLCEQYLEGLEAFSGVEQTQALTKREKEVLSYIFEGKSREDIAISMNVSVHTVHSHFSKIFQKMKVTSTQDLIKTYRY